MADRVEQGQAGGSGALEDAVDAVHQLAVEAQHGLGVVQRQQAQQIAHLGARLGRTLRRSRNGKFRLAIQ